MSSLNKFTSNNGDIKVEGEGEGEDSSSSSDDDMIEALKEATDSQFLNDTLFNRMNDDNRDKREEKIAPQKSLRRDIELVEESNDFGVTQDFKNFVAKQLAKSLDRCVEVVINDEDDSETSEKKKKKKRKGGNTSTGIKLMSNSESTLVELDNDEEENSAHNQKRGKKLKIRENFDESISKCREVAVEPDWILSKSSTAQWVNRTKGVVYKYKKSVNNGALTEID